MERQLSKFADSCQHGKDICNRELSVCPVRKKRVEFCIGLYVFLRFRIFSGKFFSNIWKIGVLNGLRPYKREILFEHLENRSGVFLNVLRLYNGNGRVGLNLLFSNVWAQILFLMT